MMDRSARSGKIGGMKGFPNWENPSYGGVAHVYPFKS
jgi:hypothetical protein